LGVRVAVVLVPVSVQMGGESLRVVGFRQGDAWARRTVGATAGGSAIQTARSLVEELPPEYRHVVTQLGLWPSGIAFKEEADGVLTLIYSIPLPTPLAEPDLPGAERWITLVEGGGSQAKASLRGSDLLHDQEPYAERVVEYWREELEEETRLFAFLPRYFTARQARDVYSAFWGYDQDPDGFATWSGIGQNKKNGVYSEHIESCGDLQNGALLSAHVEAVLAADSAQVLGGRVGATLLSESASDRAVGLWPRPGAVGSASHQALPPLVAAASLVAYQRTSRGPKPSWYKRKPEAPIEERLKNLYAPRAVWVFPPQATGTAS
jgi:hypothetical protein